MNSDSARHEVRLPDGRAVRTNSPAESLLMWREITADGYYRHATDRLRPGDKVLDIGANVGLASMAFATVGPEIVVAAEPVPETFECLRANLARHAPGAVAVRTAVAATPGTRALTYYPAAPGNSGMYADTTADDHLTRTFMRNSGIDEESIEMLVEGLHDGVEIEVQATTVSALIRDYGLDRVALLKVDVERAELDVLRGVESTDWPSIGAVVAEVHDEHGRLAEITELLTAAGLTPRVRQDPSLVSTGLYELYADRDVR